MLNGSGNLTGTFTTTPLPAGAGGFVIGISISSDGQRKLVWTDVFNCWLRDSGQTRWREVLTAASLPAADFDPANLNASLTLASGLGGTAAGKIAPSDKSRFYATFNGFLYRCDIAGGGAITATKCNLTAKRIQPNVGGQRFFGPGVDVHPTNKDILLLGTNDDGVYWSTDGGLTMTAVAGLPSPTAPASDAFGHARSMVAIDPTDGNYAYVHVHGTGLFRSTTGVSGAFTQMAGGPISCTNIQFAADGTLFLCSDYITAGPANNLWKVTRGGAWTQLTLPSGINVSCFALNPLNPGHLVAADGTGQMLVSFDYGASWLGNGIIMPSFPTSGYINRAGGEVLWYQHKTKTAYFPAQIMFDPAVANRLWLVHGLGVAYTDTLPTVWNTAPINWVDASAGIEELVASDHFVNPNTGTIFGLYGDKPIWRYNNLDRYDNVPRAPYLNGVLNDGSTPQGLCMDYAIDDPNWLVAVVGRVGGRNCFSADDGRKWIQWVGPFPGGFQVEGGSIAVSNKNNVIIAPGRNEVGRVVYTKDATNPAAVWSDITLGGVTPVVASVNAVTTLRHIVTADKQRPGVFALLVNNINPVGGALGRDIAGLWVTTNGGDNWTRTITGIVGDGTNGKEYRQFWKAKLAYIPGKSGELLYSPHADDTAFPNDELYHILGDGSGGVTALRPTEIKLVRWFGFGKAMPGQSYPAVIIYAKVNGVWGFYVSFDWFATTPIMVQAANPLGRIDKVGHVAGDMTRFGRFYMGFSGSGGMKIDYSKRVIGA